MNLIGRLQIDRDRDRGRGPGERGHLIKNRDGSLNSYLSDDEDYKKTTSTTKAPKVTTTNAPTPILPKDQLAASVAEEVARAMDAMAPISLTIGGETEAA